ncbi:MAG: hypothetical protein RIQ79_2441, partial [Verrucomicrobiota bacterium]
MKIYSPLYLAAILAMTAFAQADELPKGAKKEIKAAVKEQNGPDVPPELRTPRVDARTEKMRLLIVQGIADGQLSPGEASALEHELARIERDEKSAKKDGKASRRDRVELKRSINELHERIWKKTHNGTKP